MSCAFVGLTMSVAVFWLLLLVPTQADSQSAPLLPAKHRSEQREPKVIADLCESPIHPFLHHNPSPSSSLLASCRGNADEHESKDKKEYSGLTVIGAGFMKTGTKSIELALQMLGHTVYDFRDILLHCHGERWAEAARDWKQHGDLGGVEALLREIEALGYTATLDYPVNLFALAFAELRPNAKVLFSVRDSDEQWYSSFATHIKLWEPVMHCRPWTWLIPISAKQKTFWIQILDGLGSPLPWEPSYASQHSSRPLPWYETIHSSPVDDNRVKMSMISVQRTFQRELEDHLMDGQLLIYNVKQGWDPLLPFLDIAENRCIGSLLADQPFPHANDTKQVRSLLRILNIVAVGLPFWLLISTCMVFCMMWIIYCIGKRCYYILVGSPHKNKVGNNKVKRN